MKKYLAILNDEHYSVEINGFQVMTEKEMEYYEELATSIVWFFAYDLGDDKELEYSSGEDLLTKIDFKEISNEEYKILSKTFEDGKFGTFINEEFLQSIVRDEEDVVVEDEEGDYDKDDEDDEY